MPRTGNSVFLVYDDERGLHQDYEDWLEELAPRQPTGRYRHNRTGEACVLPALGPQARLSAVEGPVPRVAERPVLSVLGEETMVMPISSAL